MSRYIDADALKRKAQKVGTEAWKMKMTAPIETTLNQFIDWIDNAPSIDIVRCKECVHCADDWNGNQPMFTCELGRCGESVQPTDFCSYGQKGDENVETD